MSGRDGVHPEKGNVKDCLSHCFPTRLELMLMTRRASVKRRDTTTTTSACVWWQAASSVAFLPLSSFFPSCCVLSLSFSVREDSLRSDGERNRSLPRMKE